MQTKTILVSVHVLVEMDATELDDRNHKLRELSQDIEALLDRSLTDVLQDRQHTEFSSYSFACLDSCKDCGRCEVCNCWAYDAEAISEGTPRGISRGARVDDRFLCDVHLPKDHPLAF
jgi:hypothetical protein